MSSKEKQPTMPDTISGKENALDALLNNGENGEQEPMSRKDILKVKATEFVMKHILRREWGETEEAKELESQTKDNIDSLLSSCHELASESPFSDGTASIHQTMDGLGADKAVVFGVQYTEGEKSDASEEGEKYITLTAAPELNADDRSEEKFGATVIVVNKEGGISIDLNNDGETTPLSELSAVERMKLGILTDVAAQLSKSRTQESMATV